MVNLLIDVDSELHMNLKRMALEKGTTLKDLVISLLDPRRSPGTRRTRPGMVHLLIDIDPDLYGFLKKTARDRETTLKDIVRSLLRDGVEAESKPPVVRYRAFLIS